jgi:hypothetical protein
MLSIIAVISFPQFGAAGQGPLHSKYRLGAEKLKAFGQIFPQSLYAADRGKMIIPAK